MTLPNILLVVADDLGRDWVNVTDDGTVSVQAIQYKTVESEGNLTLHTEQGTEKFLAGISILAKNGVYFKEAWAQPVCSATRAALFTGYLPCHNGVGYARYTSVLNGNPVWGTVPDTAGKTIAQLLKSTSTPYSCGIFGKWHLGTNLNNHEDPVSMGWDCHAGILGGKLPDISSSLSGDTTNDPDDSNLDTEIRYPYYEWVEDYEWIGTDIPGISIPGINMSNVEGVEDAEGQTVHHVTEVWAVDTDVTAPDEGDGKTYNTFVTVDQAEAWLKGLKEDSATANNPWFLSLTFCAPHDPFHIPPENTFDDTSLDLTLDSVSTSAQYEQLAEDLASDKFDANKFNAMIQSLDHYFLNFLRSLSQADLDNTLIIFLGDNGSPKEVANWEPKSTIAEGGVRVPLIIADGHAVYQSLQNSPATLTEGSQIVPGQYPGLLGGENFGKGINTMANVIDIYWTIVDLLKNKYNEDNLEPPVNRHGYSLFSLVTANPPASSLTRDHNFAQIFDVSSTTSGGGNVGGRLATIRDEHYKLNFYNCTKYQNFQNSYELFSIADGIIPGIEDPLGSKDDDYRYKDDEIAVDIFNQAIADLQSGPGQSLNALLDRLVEQVRIGYGKDYGKIDYRYTQQGDEPDETPLSFPDPRATAPIGSLTLGEEDTGIHTVNFPIQRVKKLTEATPAQAPDLALGLTSINLLSLSDYSYEVQGGVESWSATPSKATLEVLNSIDTNFFLSGTFSWLQVLPDDPIKTGAVSCTVSQLSDLNADNNPYITVPIQFGSNSFTAQPKVVVWLTSIRVKSRKSLGWLQWDSDRKVELSALNPTPSGFDLKIERGSNTEVFALGVCWVAYMPNNTATATSPAIYSETFDAMATDYRTKLFEDSTNFSSTPYVVAAISGFNLDCKAGLDVNLSIDTVQPQLPAQTSGKGKSRVTLVEAQNASMRYKVSGNSLRDFYSAGGIHQASVTVSFIAIQPKLDA